jgi:hypothetical protein
MDMRVFVSGEAYIADFPRLLRLDQRSISLNNS